MSQKCPFCGADESSSKELFCHKCYNQIRSEVAGKIYDFPSDVAHYETLREIYTSIFQMRFSNAQNLISTRLNKSDNFEGLVGGLKKVAEDALAWAKKLCYWEVYFDNDGEPQNLYIAERADIYKDIEESANNDLGPGINRAIEQIRKKIGREGYAVRATSLYSGCTIFSEDGGRSIVDTDSIESIKGHANALDRTPMIFISAPSYNSKSGKRTIEYEVAKAFKFQLDTKGINAFWWEDFNKDINRLGRMTDKKIGSLRIAAKIAFGLAFSSVFIGFAFDLQNFVENLNCQYEINKFCEFKTSPQQAKDYVSFKEAPAKIKGATKITKVLVDKLPKSRSIRLLTLIENHKEFEHQNLSSVPTLAKLLNGDDEINVSCNNCNESIDSYVKKALETVFVIFKQDNKKFYDNLKKKNGFNSDDEFKSWFCMLTGDVRAFHEIVNAPTNYNCSYAVLDEFGADVHDKIEFFVERANYWDKKEEQPKRIIRLNMVVRESNNNYMSDRTLARRANENDENVADGCGFLFIEDDIQYHQCEVNYEDCVTHTNIPKFRFSAYTKNGGKWCIVEDINNLSSGIIGTIKFISDSGATKVFNFAITLSRQVVQIPQNTNRSRGRLYDKVKRKVHCPYCAEPLPYLTKELKQKQRRTGINCLGEECDSSKFGIRKGRILCSRNEQSNYAFALPEGYEESKSAFITMMGLRDAGKSVFISKLFEVEKNKIDFANNDSQDYKKDDIVVESVQLSDKYIKYALTPYVKSVSCYFPKALEKADDILTDSLWRKQYLNGGIFTHYCSIPYANFVLKTLGSDDVCATLHYAPLMLKLETHDGLENYFSFYDLPGEEIERVAENVKTRISALKEQAEKDEKIKNVLKSITLLQNSNGIILMVNAGANENDDHDGVCKILTKFVERKVDETENESGSEKTIKHKRVKNVALAVVLCQFDRIEHNFDFDSIVRTLPPLEDSDFYRHSKMEEYIDACSKEVKDYLVNNGLGTLVSIIDNFAYHKYFAVSAIGHQDSIKPVSDVEKRATTRFISNPRGIENVLIWLAYQMGMID